MLKKNIIGLLIALIAFVTAHGQVIYSFQTWADGGSFGKRIYLPHDSTNGTSDIIFIGGSIYGLGTDGHYHNISGSGGSPTTHIPWDSVTGKPSFSAVGLSGQWLDILNRPTLIQNYASNAVHNDTTYTYPSWIGRLAWATLYQAPDSNAYGYHTKGFYDGLYGGGIDSVPLFISLDSLRFYNTHSLYHADTIKAVGHSMVVGADSWNGSNGWAFMTDSFFHRPFDNFASGGTGATFAAGQDAIHEDYTFGSHNGLLAMIGTNDLSADTSNVTFNQMLNAIKFLYANHFAKDTLTANQAGMTLTGTWATADVRSSDASKSTLVSIGQPGATWTWNSAADSSIFVMFTGVDGASGQTPSCIGGVMKVTIDGVQVFRGSTNHQASGNVIAYGTGHRSPGALIFQHLANTTHTVVVTNDSTAGVIYLDCVGHLQGVSTVYPFLIATDPYRTVGGLANSVFDKQLVKYDSLQAALNVSGLPFYVSNSNRNFDPTTMISMTDFIHPLQIGHRVIYDNAMSALTGPIGTIARSNGTIYVNTITDHTGNKKPLPLGINGAGLGYVPESDSNRVFKNSPILDQGAQLVVSDSTFREVALYNVENAAGQIGLHLRGGYNYALIYSNVNLITGAYDDPGKPASGISMSAENGNARIGFATGTTGGTTGNTMQLEGPGHLLIGAAAITNGDQGGVLQIESASGGHIQLTANGHITQLQTDNDQYFDIFPSHITTRLAATDGTYASVNVRPALGSDITSGWFDGDLWNFSHHLYYYNGVSKIDLLAAKNDSVNMASKYDVDTAKANIRAAIGGDTYTPSITNISNVSSSSLLGASWTRNGNIIHIKVALNVTATLITTTCVVAIDLPFTSGTVPTEYVGTGTGILGSSTTSAYAQLPGGSANTFVYGSFPSLGSAAGHVLILEADYNL